MLGDTVLNATTIMRGCSKMRVLSKRGIAVLGCFLFTSAATFSSFAGDAPAFPLGAHVDQFQIRNGAVPLGNLFDAGDEMFEALYNDLDGVGANLKQDTTVSVRFSRTPRADLPGFIADPFRATGPNARSCTSCHDSPSFGGQPSVDDGSGDINSNVHRDPQRTGSVAKFIQRNTPHLFASGALQNLAQEMTTELLAIETSLKQQAGACIGVCAKTANLVAKGIAFGSMSASKTCMFFFICSVTVNKANVRGVAQDLVIRPYGWKGNVASLRGFISGAADNELGMQPVELVGGGVDQDKDGKTDEFTVGDITALTIYNAAQPRPATLLELNASDPVAFPLASSQISTINSGSSLFTSAGCAGCHTPALTMNDPVFREPSPMAQYRSDTLPSGASAVSAGLDPAFPATFNFLTDLERPLEAGANGAATVRLYSDLKWHDMGTALAESIDEAGNGASVFITEALWGAGSTAPYMHDGRSPTLTAAILAHGGEAQTARDAFAAMSAGNQGAVVEFLKNLVLFKPPAP